MPETPNRTTDKNLTTLVSELWQLILGYAKQETLDPLKSLGRYLAAGVGGAVLLGLGLVLLDLAGLRALQQETTPHLTGHLSWVPYLVVVAVSLLIIAVLIRGIGTEKRRVARERANLQERG